MIRLAPNGTTALTFGDRIHVPLFTGGERSPYPRELRRLWAIVTKGRRTSTRGDIAVLRRARHWLHYNGGRW